MKKFSVFAALAACIMMLGAGAAAAADDDMAYIKERGKLVVGITLFAPMNYYDNTTGELVGFDTELTKAVCAKLGLEPEFVEINWDTKEIELNSKNIDCIWNGMTITDERKQNMAVSRPYIDNAQVMVMKADRAEEIMKKIEGYIVTAEKGSSGEGEIQGTIIPEIENYVSAKEYFSKCEYVPSDSQAKALMEVKAGTADIALVDATCAYAMVRPDSDYSELLVNSDNTFDATYCGIAFRKGSSALEVFDAAIDEFVKDGTVAKIAEKYGLSTMMTRKF